MKVEYARPDDEELTTVATAIWDGRRVHVEADDPELRERLERAFRATSVVSEDPSLRRMGTSGPVELQPGSLTWFRVVAKERAGAATGLQARFVAATVIGGWDPAANYRSFDEQIERMDARERG
jgi:hypothetical protein